MGDELIEQRQAGDPNSRTRQSRRLHLAKWLCWARAIRPSCQHGFFSDPAWDMLLELYLDVERHPHSTISDLASRTGVGPSTIERWAALLRQEGFVQDLADHEAGFALSALGFETMNNYFDALLSKMGTFDLPA